MELTRERKGGTSFESTWLGTSEEKIAKLRLAVTIEADDLTIEHAKPTLEVASPVLRTGQGSS
jgi:hypothetical protein